MTTLVPVPPASVLSLVPRAAEAGHMAFVHSIINGSMPGIIVADSPSSPTTAIACNDSGFWHALGEPRRDLVEPWLRVRRTESFAHPTGLWSSSDGWADSLRPLFEDSEIDYRAEFHPPATLPAIEPVPRGFKLLPLDAELARRFYVQPPEPLLGVDPWVVGIWGGPESFAERSFGFVVVDPTGAIASACTACAIGGHDGEIEAEIEVGTDERYRGMGLATITGAAFLRECANRGFHPGWTCRSENVPSNRLARRLGFTPFRRVEGYVLSS